MRKVISLLSVALAFGFGMVPAAEAFTISFVPSSPTVSVGSGFTVDVVASGLSDGGAPSIGAYDFDITWDASLLSYAGTAFGTGLDVMGLGLNDPLATPGTPGRLNVFELSFDSTADLNQLQPDTFTVLTLSFDAVAAGTSSLAFMLNAIASAEGNSLAAQADLQNGSVTVAPVPLPAGVWLLLSGLGMAAGLRRRTRH